MSRWRIVAVIPSLIEAVSDPSAFFVQLIVLMSMSLLLPFSYTTLSRSAQDDVCHQPLHSRLERSRSNRSQESTLLHPVGRTLMSKTSLLLHGSTHPSVCAHALQILARFGSP